MRNWMKGDENNNDIVISSRIRLARNMKDRKLPHKETLENSRDIISEVEKVFLDREDNDFKAIHLWENKAIENDYYFKKHLISNKLMENKDFSAFLVNKDETVSIMINEEDHFRIQAISSGLNFKETYETADIYDSVIEKSVDYAFDEDLGYITACPTNLGTGMRASAMLHLPTLTMRNGISSLGETLTQVGMTIRGLYGEGSKAHGNIYQISNQVTLGVSEQEILVNLESVINQVMNKELSYRDYILNNAQIEIEDRIYRSLGIITNARLIDTKESLKLLSDVRLGVEMGIIKHISIETLNTLMVEIQPSAIQKQCDKELAQKDRNIKRSELLRQKLT
ncbi:protein arginine kinase [Clostridium cellulovorans]|uniref:Protein-arginine kinase n=1 Tax=Clostridium cellulovorans (strain ATCC 35296 / DSM 3052 / OCM 3 / 743B) TaxID=573061 RepID=D9SXC8_CLOC7|nr:protein arginine kinase [Clostridium cellulovorans]ADL53431.1 ATP:guanido phosphotransferase [Clostridium cellulovorans 743B]